MHDKSSIDALRKTASAIAFTTASVCAVLFWKLLAMADLAEPLHAMLLVATALIFGTVCFGLLALGTYCRAWIGQAHDAAADPERG